MLEHYAALGAPYCHEVDAEANGFLDLRDETKLYLANEHLLPLRKKHCGQRLPDVGKYSWRIMREEYNQMTSVLCPDMHDVEFTFNSLQKSSSYEALS